MGLTYNMVVDLAHSTRTNTIEVKKDNSNSITLSFSILADGEAYDMTDVAMASIKGVKPDDSIIYAAGEIVTDDDGNNTNVVTYTLSSACTSVTGKSTYEHSFVDGEGAVINSFNFYLYIINTLFDESDLYDTSDVSAVASYLARALAAATSTEELYATFVVQYGTVESILNALQTKYDEYVEYLQELQEKVDSGYFTGARGPQGNDGADAVVAEAAGVMAFQIVDGDLICYYWDEDAPPLSINDSGELIYTY